MRDVDAVGEVQMVAMITRENYVVFDGVNTTFAMEKKLNYQR